MKRLKFILFSFLFLSSTGFSQSPTYQALLRLSHSAHNNMFNVDVMPTLETLRDGKSSIWHNVYFKYFKNPNMRGSQRADENMKFSIMHEIQYTLYLRKDTLINIDLDKSAKDKVVGVSLYVYSVEDDKIERTKLKGKLYSLIKESKRVSLQIEQGTITPGTLVRIIFEIESYNFRKLGPFNFSKPMTGDYRLLLTANIPELFKYAIPEDILLEAKRPGSIALKEFTYLAPPIVDYRANSFSYRWKIGLDQAEKQLIFNLESVNITKDIGTSAAQLAKASE